MTPQTLLRLGAGLAVLGGGLRIAAAFIPYTPQSPMLEAIYAAIDITLLLGLTAIYAQHSGRLGCAGLAAFVVSFAGIASIVGPDATMFGVDWYQAGAAISALGLAMFGAALLFARRMILPALCWITAPAAALVGPEPIATQAAGVLFGLGFVLAGLSRVTQPAAGTG